MFNNNKKRQSDFEKISAEIDLIVLANQVDPDKKPLWLALLEDLDRRVQIFQWEDGKIVLGKKGFPQINWSKVITNLPTIIAYLAKLLALVKR